MNSKELAEVKDGILYERAKEAMSYSVRLCTDDMLHMFLDNKVLCGMNVKAVPTKRVALSEDNCKACGERLYELVLEQIKVESRNYWLYPSRKANISLPGTLKPKKEPKMKYVKEMLPSELLPTDNGMGFGIGVKRDHQESEG